MLHADWLSNAITVPYVPTLGPVHPDVDIVELFQTVIDLKAGQFLPFDKDQRWSDQKDEIVLADEVEHRVDRTAIATLSRRGRDRVTVYHYAETPPDLASAREHAGKLAAGHGAATSRVVWFQHGPPSAEITLVRALLAPTHEPGEVPGRPILALKDAAPVVQASFPSFAERAGDGMAYLGRCWAAGRIDTPVLVSTDQDRIVGAIGPMQTFPSPTSALQLLPQYFAVLPNYRRAGHGRALWRAAQQWGHHTGASYQLLQVAAGSPAEELYHSEGVHSLGLVCSVTA